MTIKQFGVEYKASPKDEFQDLSVSFNKTVNSIRDLIVEVSIPSEIVLSNETKINSMFENLEQSLSSVSEAIFKVSKGTVTQAESNQNSAERMSDLPNDLDEVSTNLAKLDNLATLSQELGN